MKKSMLKSFFAKAALVLALSTPVLSTLSCDIGLGASVDVLAPSLTISYPPTGAIVMDKFKLAGECSDDVGVMSVQVTVKSTDTGVVVFSGNARVTLNNWEIDLNEKNDTLYPSTNGWQFADGTYEISAIASDNSGKNSGNISRTIEIDNTAPVFIIEKPGVTRQQIKLPASDSSHKDPSAYGTAFSVTGTIADLHSVSRMDLDIYDSDGNLIPGAQFTESSVSTAGGTEVSVARYIKGNRSSAEYKEYEAIYGQDPESVTSKENSEKQFYCTIRVADNAKIYQSKGDSGVGEGNVTSDVYLYNDVYTDYLSSKSGLGLSASDVMNILSGTATRSYEVSKETLLSLLCNTSEIDKNLAFTIDPIADPVYTVNGYDISPDFTTFPSGASQSSVSATAQSGKDGTLIRTNSLHLFVKKFGSVLNHDMASEFAGIVTTTAEKNHKKMIPGKKEYDADYTNLNYIEDMLHAIGGTGKITREEVASAINTYTFYVDESRTVFCLADTTSRSEGTDAKVTVNSIMPPSSVLADEYFLFALTGYDADYSEISQSNGYYGFKGEATGTPPETFIDEPLSLSFRKSSAASDLKFKGTMRRGDSPVERMDIEILVTDEEKNEVLNKENPIRGTITAAAEEIVEQGVSTGIYDWQFNPANLEGYDDLVKVESEGKSYLYDATLTGVGENSVTKIITRSVHIDSKKPIISFSSISPVVSGSVFDGSGNAYVNGKLTFKVNIDETNLSTDEDAVSFYVFTYDESGTRANVTSTALGGRSNLKGKTLSFTETIDTKDLTDGAKLSIMVRARDKAGNVAEYYSDSYTDESKTSAGSKLIIKQETDRPRISPNNFELNLPRDQIKINHNLFGITSNNTLSAIITDDDGVASVSAGWRSAGSDQKFSNFYSKSGMTSTTFSMNSTSFPFGAGEYEIQIEAKDTEGNPSGTLVLPINIAVSQGAPDLSIGTASGDFKAKGIEVEVKGTVSTDNQIVSFKRLAAYGKQEKSVAIADNAWTDKFTSGTDQQNYVETYVATDKYGQIASREFRYKIDTLLPLVYGDSRVLIEDKAISVENFVFTGNSVDQGDATVNSGVKCLYYQVLPTSAATPSVDVADGWTIINATGTWKLPLEFVAYGTKIDPAEATTKFAEGEYNLHVYAVDNAGNKSGVSSSRFDVKLSPPSVNDLVARNAGDDTVITKTNNDGFRYTYSVSDSYTPVPPTVEAKVFKNGVEYTTITSDFTYPNGTVTVKGLSLDDGVSDGTYMVEVVATDHFKKKSTGKAKVIYDGTRPVKPVIIYPGETSQWFNKPEISVNGTASDNSGGVGLKYVYFANGTEEPDHASGNWKSIPFNNGEWNGKVKLTSEGSGTNMFIYSVDEVGNVSETAWRSLNLDRTPPVVSDINFSNAEGQSGTFAAGIATLEYSKASTYTISGNIKDNLCAVSVGISCDGYNINDASVSSHYNFTPTPGKDGKEESWSLLSKEMSDGQHIYSIRGYDAAGNETSEIIRTVVVDTKAPEIGEIGRPNEKETQSSFYVFSGLIGDGDKTSGIKERGVKFSATGSNGKTKEYNVSGTQSWTSTVTFDSADPESPFNAEGPVTISVTATDNAGNTSTKTAKFTYDKANPSLIPDAALPVGYMPKDGVVVKGVIADSYKLDASKILVVEETFKPTGGSEVKTTWTFSRGSSDTDIKVSVNGRDAVPMTDLASYIPREFSADYYFVPCNCNSESHASVLPADGNDGKTRKFDVSVRAPIKVNDTTRTIASPEDGEYSYKLFTYDSERNTAFLEPSTKLTADLMPPEVFVTKPTDRNTGINAIVDQLYQFKGTSSDTNVVSKICWFVGTDSTTPSHDDARFSSVIQGDVGNWTIPYSFKAKNDTASDATPEGKDYKLFIYAEDGATNKSDVQTIVFDVDFNAPKFDENATGFEISDNTKVLTATTKDKNFRFEYKATDTHGLSGHPTVVVKFEDDSGSRTLETSEYTVEQNTLGTDDDYNRTGYVQINNAADGYYTFELTATDVVGKKTLIKKSIRLDTTPPKIEVSTPAFDPDTKKSDWEGNGDGKVNVIGSATDKTGVSGVYYKVASGASVPSPGDLTVSSVWTNAGWKKAGTTNWKFSDANFNSESRLYGEGEFNISIAAVDTIGTVSDVETYTLYVDKSNPVISNIEISTDNGTNWTAVSNSKATIAYKKYKLRGKFSDGNKVTASYNGTYYNSVKNETTKLYEGEFEITESTAVDDGIKYYVIKATDDAGKEVRVEIAVTVDTTAPTVEFISPDFDDWQTGQNANGQVKVSGSASDNTTSVEAVWFKKGDSVDFPTGLTKENAKDASTWTNDGWTYAGKTSWNVANANAGVEGVTKVSFVAVDTCGNYTEVTTQNLKVDKGAPKIEGIKYTTVASPAERDWIDLPENGIITSKRYKIKGTYSDGTTTTVHNNEGKFTDITGLNGEWIIDESATDAAEGKHEYTVTATDQASNVTAKTIAVTVDTVAPILAVTSPNFESDSSSADYRKSDWQVVADKRVKINGTSEDETTSVLAVWYKVGDRVTLPVLTNAQAIDNSNWTDSSNKWTKASGTTSWSITETFAEGTNTLNIAAVDAQGNVSTSAEVYHVRVDAGKPVFGAVEYQAEGDGDTWKAMPASGIITVNKYKLRGTFTDGTNVKATYTGEEFTSELKDGKYTGTWTIDETSSDVAEGTKTYTITAKDEAGNTETKAVTFRVDTKAPPFAITSPDFNEATRESDWQVVADKRVKLNGTASDDTSVKAIWYKVFASVPETVPELPSGDKTLDSNWTGWKKAKGTTSWSIADPSNSAKGPVFDEGSNYLYIATVDSNGNAQVASSPYNLRVDAGAPAATDLQYRTFNKTADDWNEWTAYTSGVALNNKKFQLRGKFTDGTNITVTCPETGFTVTGNETKNAKWVLSNEVVDDGTYNYTVKATDQAGNEKEETLTVRVDTTAPEVKITSHDFNERNIGTEEAPVYVYYSDYTSGTNNITILGSGEDPSGIKKIWYKIGDTATVPENPADESIWTTAGWKAAGGTATNWKIPLTGLSDGETKISIAAVDNLNNVSKNVQVVDKSPAYKPTESISLFVDKEKPYINRSNAVESDVVVTQLDTVNKYSYLNDKGTGYSSKKFKLSGKVADAYKVASIEVKITGGTGDNAFDKTFYSDQTKTDKLVVTKTDSDRNWAWETPAFVVGSATAGTGEYKLSDANYTVTITGRDAGGQEVEITETIVIDTDIPEFTSEVKSTAKVKPAAEASEDDKKAFHYWYQSQVLNVLVKTTETGSGMETVTYRVGSNDPIPLTADATKTEWTAAVTMENTAGENTVTIIATDKAGNVQKHELKSYPGGSVKPYVDVVKPAIDNSLDKVKVKVGGDAEKTNVNSLLLNGKTTVELVVPVTDQGSEFAHVGNTATDIYITKFGKPVSGKALKGVYNESRGGYVFTIPANDGTNDYQKSGSIEIKAVDRCGNETSSTLLMQITVDETAPTVQITAPTYESHTVTAAESADANSEYYGIAEGVVKIVNGKKDVRGTVDDTYADSIELWYTTTLEDSATDKKPYAGGEVVIDGGVTTAGTPEDFGWTKYEFTEDENTVGTITDPSKVYNWNFKNLDFNNLSGADEAISSDGKKYTGIGKIYVLPVAKDKAGNSNAYTISLNAEGKTVYTWNLSGNATEYMVDMNRDRPVVQVTNITRKQVEEKKEDGSSYDPKKYKWVYNLKYGTNSQISGAISDDDAENGTVAKEFWVSETPPNGRAGGASGTTWSGSDWTFQPEDINDGPKKVYFYIEDNNGTKFFTGNTKKPGTGRNESATSDLFQPYFQFKSEAKENNDSVIIYNSDSNSPAVSSAQMWVYNDEFQKQPGYDGTDKPTFENISSTVIVGGEKYNKVEFDLTATDACGVAGFVLDITDSADTPNTVKLYTGEVPVDGIVKKDARGVWVEDTATQKDPNSILYTDGKWYKSDYTKDTRVEGFRVVDSTTSKWKTDKISMSQFATGEVNVKIDVYDNSELKGSGSNTFKVDNAGPAVTNIEPAANTPKSGNVDLSGYASDSEKGGAGVDKVYYLIPTKEQAAWSDADLKALSWQDKSSSKSPWHFLFNGGGTAYDCPNLSEYSSTTYSSKDDQDYWTIPVFIKAVDVLGNYSITRHSVYYNPDGDRVVTGFTYPTEDNYDMDETTRLDYATLGSTIRISGTVNTADPESAARADGVYLQIVEASYKAKRALTLYKANAELKLIKDGNTNNFRKIIGDENPELIFAKGSYLGADHIGLGANYIGKLVEGTDYIVETPAANAPLTSLQIAWLTTEDYEETYDFDDASAKVAAADFELGTVCDADHVPGGKKTIAPFVDGTTNPSGFATNDARNAWWGLATTNTASSWNISINANAKLNPADNTHVTRHFAVRASTINSNGKIGAWSTPVIYIHVDNAAPTISSIMCKFADGAFEAPGSTAPVEITGDLPSPIATTSYKPGMFLKGLWYLVADVVDEGSIKSISENGVVISGTTTTMYYKNVGTDANKKYKVYVPINTIDENRLHTYKITATDTDSGNNHTVTSTYQFYIDNTAPEVGMVTSTATGENEFKSGDEGVRSAYDIKDSNGQFNLSSPIEESGSGFERTVFYFVRKSYNGTTLSSGENGIIDPFSINSINSAPTKDKTLLTELVEVPTDTSQPPLYGKSITGKVTDDAHGALVRFTADTAADISGNSHIRVGGLVYVDGVFKRIESITGGVVTLDSVISGNKNEEKTAVFIYAQVVDNENTETVGSLSDYGFNFKNSSDDNDGMPEVIKTKTGGVTWGADIRSSNMADGPVTVVILAFDKAGNVSGKEINTYISNNAPRIAKVYLGTNIDRSKVDSADSFTQEEFVEYNWKEERGTMTLNTADYVNGLEKPGQGTPFTIKQGLAVVPEVIGGNSSVKMVFKKDAENADPTAATSGLGALRENTTAGVSTAWMIKYDTDSTGRFLAYTLTNADLNGGAEPTVERNSDGTGKKMSFTFWDETEDTTQGLNSQNAVLYVTDFTVDLVDQVMPTVVVNPFYWNKINDNSIQGSGNVKSVDNLNGHIELESDIVNTALNAAPYTPGAPKISGKVVFTGTAYDNQAIGSISAKFENIVSGDIAKYVPATADVAAHWTVAAKTLAADGYAVTVSDAGKTYSYDGTQKSTASESDKYGNWKDSAYFGQEGHKVYWTLTVDTEKLTDTADTDVALTVLAKDLTGNTTSTTTVTARFKDADGEDYTRMAVTDGTSNVPGYTVDVVPYVTKVTTALEGSLKSSIRPAYTRTTLGNYIVRSSETVKILGFNLKGTKYGTDTDALKSITDEGGNVLGVEFPLSKMTTSGEPVLKVEGVQCVNNINNNNACGSYKTDSTDVSEVSSYEVKSTYAYNRRPNERSNNLLTDNVEFDIWEFDSDAAVPRSGKLSEPVMKINPKTGKVGFAFVSGPADFSMSTDKSDNGYVTGNSYNQYQSNYATFTNVSFTYDPLGNSHGTTTGLDTYPNGGTDTFAGRFTYVTGKWGVCLIGKMDDNYYKDNKIRLEAIGVPEAGTYDNRYFFVKGAKPSTYTMTETRFSSPSIAATSHGDNSSVYIAYYDDVQGQIRFRHCSQIPAARGDNYWSADRDDFTDNRGLSDELTRGSDASKHVFDSYTDYFSLIAGKDWQRTSAGEAVNQDTTNFFDTGYAADRFVAIDAYATDNTSEASAANDVVVVVWYDGKDCLYSYTTNPTSKVDMGTNDPANGWAEPKKIFSDGGEFCTVKIAPDHSVHIAANVDGALRYAYLRLPDAEYSEDTDSVLVDSFSVTGEQITIDVGLKTVNNKTVSVPYISYYMGAAKLPVMATIVVPENGVVNYKAQGTGTNDGDDIFTGNWNIAVVPSPNRLSGGVNDKMNVALWKSTAQGSVGQIVSNQDNSFSDKTKSNSNTSDTTSGNCYGNGTANAIIGYAIKSDTGTCLETAQMK